jgi:hypothetical protein
MRLFYIPGTPFLISSRYVTVKSTMHSTNLAKKSPFQPHCHMWTYYWLPLVNPCSPSQARPKWDVGLPNVVSFVDP